MKIASWNVNGLRAVERKGELKKFLTKENPDVFFLQEIKVAEGDVPQEFREHPEYHQFYNSAQKPGYAGTGCWIRKNGFKDIKFSTGMPHWEDTEGRIARLDFNSSWTMIGVYFPNGGKSSEAWQGKLKFYDAFLNFIDELKKEKRKVLFCGDINCAHEEIDLARPKENQKNIGFLPEERAWVTKVVAHGWSDVFREKHPKEIIYSWWAPFAKSRERNVGWRIDSFFLDEKLMPLVKKISYLNEQMGSDHCPVVLELEVN